MVHYWGQNSYGGAHLETPKNWEKDLQYYCTKEDVDVINLSFLNVFNAGKDALPEINFSNHCGDFFNDTVAKKVRYCPQIGKDIKFCQSRGKTILLSLGGAVASTGFPSSKAASEFAETLWNMFMGGKHKYRPFDDAIVDGIDLDLEGGSQENYPVFLAKMQSYFKSGGKQYFVTAAPQCEFPDRNLQTIMEQGHVDAILIQFYNNWCGVHNYGNQWAWNWPMWSEWAKTKSFNKKVKLILGVPAASSAAGSGYIELPALKKIVSELRNNNTFGGIMLWDASQNEYNRSNNTLTFSQNIKSILAEGSKCSLYSQSHSAIPSSMTKPPKLTISKPSVNNVNTSHVTTAKPPVNNVVTTAKPSVNNIIASPVTSNLVTNEDTTNNVDDNEEDSEDDDEKSVPKLNLFRISDPKY